MRAARPLSITVAEILRYPVKGLGAETLGEAALVPGEGLPNDRRFAIAHSGGAFDADNPEWLPKHNFLNLMTDEKLAGLRPIFEQEQGLLALTVSGERVAEGRLDKPSGLAPVERFIESFMAEKGSLRIVQVPGRMLSDSPQGLVSIINIASVRDIGRAAGRAVDPRRFRANIHLEGGTPWEERDWPGRSLRIGAAELRVVDPINRCAATCVDPETAARDMNVPRILKRAFGHVETGVYAEVTEPGTIRKGDPVVLI